MRKMIFGIAIVGVLFVIIGPLLGAVAPTYSEGDRVGVVTKFSNKGMMIKSWEGELNMGGFKNVSSTDADGNTINSVGANVFEFSVRDEGVVSQIKEAMESGKRVELHYLERLWTPYDQSTAYEITAVKMLDNKPEVVKRE